MKKIICYFILSMLISGCASVLYRTDGSKFFSSKIYPGVSSDLELMGACSAGDSSYELASPELRRMSKLIFFAALIDTPFSFILDTVLLPFDLLQPKEKNAGLEPA